MLLYTIIAQYRTGGQNLMYWINQSLNKEFTIIHEPFNSKYTEYTTNTTLQDFSWLEDNKKYFIKELWYPELDYKKLLQISNKVICLYRENSHEQTISHLYSTKKNRYHHQYTQKDIDKIYNQEEYEKFKNEIHINKNTLLDFAKENSLPLISYEELYYENGIEKFKEIFEFKSDVPFPIGIKYFTNQKKLI